MCGAAALVKERRADRIRAVAIVVRCSMVVVAKGRGGTMFAPLRQRAKNRCLSRYVRRNQ